MWLDIFLAVFTLILFFFCIGMTYASVRIITHKVPPIPTGRKIAQAMVELAKITQNQSIYDLGCGFGTILFTADKKAPQNKFIGFDVIDPILWSDLIRAGLTKKNITIVKQDYFRANISEADVLFCYLWPSIMERIETELWNNLKPGTRLISHAFILPNIKPAEMKLIGPHKVYLYVR